MAERRVRVTVICTDKAFRVSVRPYAARVSPNQSVRWIAGGRITDLRIRKHSSRTPSIFRSAPKPIRYGGTLSVKSGKRKPLPGIAVGRRIPYAISLHFTDSNNKRRSATIDPDMVIDS